MSIVGALGFGPDDRSQLRLQHLERDLALVLQVVGQVDRGHPALAELALDAIAALEGRVQAGDGIAHFGTSRFSSSKKFWTRISLDATPILRGSMPTRFQDQFESNRLRPLFFLVVYLAAVVVAGYLAPTPSRPEQRGWTPASRSPADSWGV